MRAMAARASETSTCAARTSGSQRSTTSATLPFSAAWAAKSCASKFAPRKQKKSPACVCLRESALRLSICVCPSPRSSSTSGTSMSKSFKYIVIPPACRRSGVFSIPYGMSKETVTCVPGSTYVPAAGV